MLQNYNLWRVAGVFFKEPTKEHYVKGISRQIGLAHTSVGNYLAELSEMGIIEKRIEKRGSRVFPLFSAQRNELFFGYKKLHNLWALQDSGLIEKLEELAPDCIVLFGSFMRGEDTEKSDIDLFVQAEPSEQDLNFFEEKLSRKIELRFSESFRRYPEELKNNIINGIVLSGYLDA